MKVGLVEINYHAGLVSTFIDIFSNQIDVFTTKEVYRDIDKDMKYKANFIIKSENISNKKFIDDIKTEYYDIFIVNTIQESMINGRIWLDFKPRCKSILVLHNINAWCNKKFILNKNILHSLDSYMFSMLSNRILDNYDYLSVVYRPMIEEASNKLSRDIIFTPFSVARNDVDEGNKKTIDFVIPGTVDKKRRKYDIVIKAFKEIIENNKDVRLIFLGKLKDYTYIKNYDNFVTFDNYVNRNVYERYCMESDFIITPSLYETHTVNVVKEIYGLSKSPNVHEAIKYRKPIIAPKYLNLDNSMKDITLQYVSSEDIIKQVDKFLDNKKNLAFIKKRAFNNMEEFSRWRVMKELMRQIN